MRDAAINGQCGTQRHNIDPFQTMVLQEQIFAGYLLDVAHNSS